MRAMNSSGSVKWIERKAAGRPLKCSAMRDALFDVHAEPRFVAVDPRDAIQRDEAKGASERDHDQERDERAPMRIHRRSLP